MYMGSIGAGCIHLQKMGILEDQLSDGSTKNASKRTKGQVCICRAIRVITVGNVSLHWAMPTSLLSG
jgi:hypothetical protein